MPSAAVYCCYNFSAKVLFGNGAKFPLRYEHLLKVDFGAKSSFAKIAFHYKNDL